MGHKRRVAAVLFDVEKGLERELELNHVPVPPTRRAVEEDEVQENIAVPNIFNINRQGRRGSRQYRGI